MGWRDKKARRWREKRVKTPMLRFGYRNGGKLFGGGRGRRKRRKCRPAGGKFPEAATLPTKRDSRILVHSPLNACFACMTLVASPLFRALFVHRRRFECHLVDGKWEKCKEQ